VPWCNECDRFLSPNTVRTDGTCPTCHGAVGEPQPAAVPTATAATEVTEPTEPTEDDGHSPVPWHLWLLLAALVVYLGYRAFQGLELLFGF
jgi:hypothetical protein